MLTPSNDSGSPLAPAPAGPARRSVLAAFGALGLVLAGGLAGCTEKAAPAPAAPPPSADELAVGRAVDAARQLRADAMALSLGRPTLAGLLPSIIAVHEAHLAALGAAVEAPGTVTGTAAAAASGSETTAPSAGGAGPTPASTGTTAVLMPTPTLTPTPTPQGVISGEWTAARTALRDGEAATPALAVLLCRIAAARATNADLISGAAGRRPPGLLVAAAPSPTSSPTGTSSSIAAGSPTATGSPTAAGSPTGTSSPVGDPAAAAGAGSATSTGSPDGIGAAGTDPTDADQASPPPLADPTTPGLIAVNKLLAGQHAAVYAYPLIVARAATNRREQARRLWQAHLTDRDLIATDLVRSDAQPVAAEPAYQIEPVPDTSALAAALGARVERGLAALAAQVIAQATGADRLLGADQLVLAARRTAGWDGESVPFPGLSTAAPGASATPATPAVSTSAPEPTAPAATGLAATGLAATG